MTTDAHAGRATDHDNDFIYGSLDFLARETGVVINHYESSTGPRWAITFGGRARIAVPFEVLDSLAHQSAFAVEEWLRGSDDSIVEPS